MALKISRSLVWFVVAGSLAFLVDAAVLALLRNSLGVYGARVVSFWLAATLTWLINRRLSFAGRRPSGSVIREYLQYLALMLGGGSVNLAVYSTLAWQFAHTPLLLTLYVAAGTLAGMCVNYLGMSRFLYRDRSEK